MLILVIRIGVQDESITASVCVTLATVCGGGSARHMVECVLQQGILQKLVDLCATPNARWAAVCVLCAILKSPNPLHKYVVLQHRFRALDMILLEMGEGRSAGSNPEIVSEHWVSL